MPKVAIQLPQAPLVAPAQASERHEDGHHGMGTDERSGDGDWESDDAVVGSGDTETARRVREEAPGRAARLLLAPPGGGGGRLHP